MDIGAGLGHQGQGEGSAGGHARKSSMAGNGTDVWPGGDPGLGPGFGSFSIRRKFDITPFDGKTQTGDDGHREDQDGSIDRIFELPHEWFDETVQEKRGGDSGSCAEKSESAEVKEARPQGRDLLQPAFEGERSARLLF